MWDWPWLEFGAVFVVRLSLSPRPCVQDSLPCFVTDYRDNLDWRIMETLGRPFAYSWPMVKRHFWLYLLDKFCVAGLYPSLVAAELESCPWSPGR